MGLRVYMLLSSLINLTLFALLAVLASLSLEDAPVGQFAILVPIVIAGFQISAVLPRARALPIEQRTSFFAYREANKPTYMIAAIVIFSAVVLAVQSVGGLL